MNKLALATVVTALASQAAGCIIETTDRNGGGGELAAISARWSLRNMTDGAVTECPRGFDTVQVIAQAVDEFGDAIDEGSVDLFDCGRRTGTSRQLVPDVYRVWIEVRSRDLSRLYAQSLSQILDVRDVDQKFQTEILNDGGYFQLSWDLIGAESSRPLSCSQVAGLDRITALSTSITDSQFAYDDQLLCEDHAAVTAGLFRGSYTITLSPMAADRPIGAPTRLTNEVISGQNAVTDLGHIVIPIDGL